MARVMGLLWQRYCGVRIEASGARRMTVMSDVRDVALVVLVYSSLVCLWVCLGMFVAMKSKLLMMGSSGVR